LYSSGCVKQETFYNNGQLDGPVTYYARNCKKDYTENYKNGVKEGLEIQYFSKRRIKSEALLKKEIWMAFYKVYKSNGEFSFESRSTTGPIEFDADVADTS